MGRAIIRRLLLSIPVLWLVVTATFVVVHLAPGSAEDVLQKPGISPEAREQIRRQWGLDRPVHEQYLHWLGHLVRGDLGVSYNYRRPVSEVLRRALPPTLLLTGTALALTLVVGVALGLAAVRRPGGWVDRVTTVLSLGIYGLPPFWLALMALLVFSVGLGWFPPSHMHSVGAASLSAPAAVLDLVHHLVLPAGCLGLAGAAATGRYLRSTLLDAGRSRFILGARARGIPPRRLLWVHALRPALIPVVTILGLSIPFLVSGSLVVEAIFAWPGMGRVMWTAAMARDVPMVLATTLVAGVGVVLGTLLADVLYAVVDPRVRESA